MNIQDTSLDAFFELKKTPTIGDQCRKILSVMTPNTTYTRRGIAALAKLETSTASARINSLLDTHIEVVGAVKDPMTKKTVQALMLKVSEGA